MSLPDISKWKYFDIDNECNVDDCYLLLNLPEIKFKNFLITYEADKILDKKLKIFGKNFVENNKDKCEIICCRKEFKLTEFFEDSDIILKFKDIFEFILRLSIDITNLSYMFSGCIALLSVKDFNKDSHYKNDVRFENHKFSNPSNSLASLPDISSWNTKKITDLIFLFSSCCSLESLPDLSRWFTIKITDLSYMFYNCNSLISLPDISA